MKQPHKAILLIITAALLGGVIGVFQKIALRELAPMSFTLIRFVLATLTLLPFALKQGVRWKKLNRIVPLSLLATANITFFIFGLEKTTVTVSGMLYAAVPLIAAIFSYIILRERVTAKKMAGITLGFLGVILIVALPAAGAPAEFDGTLAGNLIILIAVCAFALYSVLSKKFQNEYTPIELTMFFIIITTVIQALLLPLDSGYAHVPLQGISWQTIVALLYVGIIGTGVYYLLYQEAIKAATPIMASMILYLVPISSVVWAGIILGEKLTMGFVAGSALAFIGVALVTSPEKSVV